MSGYNKEVQKNFVSSQERFSKKSIVAADLHKEYGEQVILWKESLSINPGDKIGLLGRNGSGKSTLIRILAGIEKPDDGMVTNGGLKIGYLAQNFLPDEGKTIFEVMTEGSRDVVQGLGLFEKMNVNFKTKNEEFIEEYSKLLGFLETKEAFTLSERIGGMLDKIGANYPFDTRVASLSGGEIVRLGLAKILFANPDILLLDEPTNHLDLRANLWLREFLINWSGGLLVVSHDRDFLDDVTSSTWELKNGKIKVFGGNYDFYKEQLGIEAEARKREIIRLEAKVKKTNKLVQGEQKRAAHSARKDRKRKPDDRDKYLAGYRKDKATKFAGKKKALLQQSDKEFVEQLEGIKSKQIPSIAPLIKESGTHKGKLLIKAKNISCSYGQNEVITETNLGINFGDRIALFGNNGTGKTTLIKGLLGRDDLKVKGEVKMADGINIQLLDQNYKIVNRNLTVLENIEAAAPGLNLPETRKHLARFLFMTSLDVNKSGLVLSGGELARLALAMIAAMPLDLLILDEPTNNLDTNSIEEIETVLERFKGALLVISHDLSFLRRINICSSYVIANKRLHKLITNPGDNESFKEELLTWLS